ncbi:MAG: FAD-dependent oxidoreductase, partial [bacterium]|nr:FAD-dependent oxidoreductase [bacterium]
LVVKISGDEMLPGGNTLNEARIIARELEKAGVQALHVSPGGHETSQPLSPGFVPKGSFLHLASAIKEEVRLPVITAHIGDPALAEKALSEGKSDLIAFGRQFIADPSFPLKLKSGKIQEIRRCLRCCQGCYDQVFANQPVTCLVNPAVGREKEFDIKSATQKKNVMVVGAGPAGMEAAYILASRGYEVHLYEKNHSLGGQMRLASIPPGKEEFAFLADYFVKALPEIGVNLHLETLVTPELVEKEKPQSVVIATGSEPVIPGIPGFIGSNVVTAHQVLADNNRVGSRVVIIGGGGTGCETALYLARQDRQITLLEMLPSAGSDIGISRRGHVRKSLSKCGVQVITGAKVKEIKESGVVYLKDNHEFTILADTVVLAMGMRPRNELYESLKGKVKDIYLIG